MLLEHHLVSEFSSQPPASVPSTVSADWSSAELYHQLRNGQSPPTLVPSSPPTAHWIHSWISPSLGPVENDNKVSVISIGVCVCVILSALGCDNAFILLHQQFNQQMWLPKCSVAVHT